MKLLVLLGMIILGGIILTLFALQYQSQEIGAQEIMLQAESKAAETLPEAKQSTANQAPIAEASPQELNVTRGACLALEQQLQGDLDDAERDLGRARKEYEDAEENYDDALSANDQDPQYLDQLQSEKEEAKNVLEDEEGDYNGAQKRLSRARLECGLFQ